MPGSEDKALKKLKKCRDELEQTAQARTGELELIFDSAPAWIVYKDKDNRFLRVNEAFAKVLGKSRKQLEGRSLFDFYPKEQAEAFWKDDKEVLASGKPKRNIVEPMDIGRKTLWVQTDKLPWRDARGDMIGVIAFSRDITERKRAEEDLVRTISLLEATLDSTADGILVVDLEGKITRLNKRFLEMWRIPPSVVQSHSDDQALAFVLDQLMEPDQFLRKVRELYSQPLVESFDVLNFRDGRTFERFSRPQLIDRVPVGRVWSFRDATERMKVEEGLRQSEAALNKAQRVSHVGSWTWHIPSNRVEWSDEMFRIFGIRKDEFNGDLAAVIARAIHPDDRAAVEQVNLSVIQRSVPIPLEYRVVWPDGTERTVWAEAGELVLDKDGHPATLTGVVQDITERKRAETILRRRMEELSLLSRASQAVTGSLNLDEVLSEIVLLAGKVAQSDFASVVLVDEEGRVKGKSAETLPGAPALEYRLRGEGFTHWIIRTLRPAVVDALDEDGVIRSALEEGAPKTANPLLLKYGIKSFVGLPLIAKGRLLGVLYLHSLHAYAFGDRLPILIAFGNQAAVAIENARLYDEVQKELDRRKEAEGKLSESNRGLREALRELEQSQDMLQLIIESIPVRVFWKDEDLRYLGCNALFARDAGFSHPQELLGKDDFAMGWRDQAEIYRADDRIVIESRQPKLHIVEPQTTPLGATIWLSTSKVPLVKPDGKILGILGVYEDITLRRQDEEKLKASLRERDVMLREIHHRVKNNIQIISSLLRLQSRRIRDKQALEALGESQNRIKSMALIHEKLYQSQDFTRIDFADYISKMIIHLFAIYKVDAGRIRYRVEAENINLDINGAIPCGLIINELVTNALKHAFPEEREGELIIRMRRDGEDRYTLTVKDSGIGLPKGFDFDRKDTLGFQIVNDLVNQLDGTIEVSCVGGTEIVVRF